MMYVRHYHNYANELLQTFHLNVSEQALMIVERCVLRAYVHYKIILLVTQLGSSMTVIILCSLRLVCAHVERDSC